MEYTLEDAFESLKDTLTERQKEMENLCDMIMNNKPIALDKTCTSEDVRKKQHKLCKSLLNKVLQEIPKDYPIPHTSDLHIEILTELENEVLNAQQLLDKMKMQLSNINEDISYLEKKKMGSEKMREAFLSAEQLTDTTTYNKEHVITKRMFKNHMLVEMLFPENQHFKDCLGNLTSAYTKGGDEMYISITPETLVFMNFLLEAGIIMYHRNDKTKVRLMDML
ncbi:uncharacterized protein LOC100869070 isoform X2 [Apis florea]|uniref:uncharacterized protein LOC100869070 isoform X2 n=1 Tax=Apis florea TaxID=7463 RepID=UPI0006291661|nr:uncharacterized protein LOC100869070 isoform X2 [Apis florea]